MEINFLFIIVTALFVYMTIRGYRRGFLRLIITFAGTLLIIVAAKKASPYITDYLLNNTEVYQKIQTSVQEKFAEANERYDNTIPENQVMTIESYDVPDLLKNNLILNNTAEMYTALLVSVFEEYVSAYLANTAVKAAGFVIAFLILIAAFKILLTVVDIISRIPIIKGFNKLAGGCLGFMEALIIVWVFFFAAVMFVGNDSGSAIFKMIADSKFLSLLFDANILIRIIM